MTVLILEDEIPAYNKLLKHLQAYYSNDLSHDWARSIAEAEPFLKNTNYDLILSDIQLLDGLSFDLFNTIKVTAPIIFCSAYDNYLFEAFKTFGIAYILKPYTDTDFISALDKYQKLFTKPSANAIDAKTLSALKSAIAEPRYKTRFVIKRPTGIQLLSVSEISCIDASGDFCIATDAKGKRHTISGKIGELINLLDPKKFFRINRSHIVNIEAIQNIENHFKNRLLLSLVGYPEKVMTSTATTSNFRKWIEQ